MDWQIDRVEKLYTILKLSTALVQWHVKYDRKDGDTILAQRKEGGSSFECVL